MASFWPLIHHCQIFSKLGNLLSMLPQVSSSASSSARSQSSVTKSRKLAELVRVGRDASRVLCDSHDSMDPLQPQASDEAKQAAIDRISSHLNCMIPSDFGVRYPLRADFDRMWQRYGGRKAQAVPPVLAMDIGDQRHDPLLQLVVFCLRDENSFLPLHDHTGMHGFLRVLRGKLELTSYSWPTKQQIAEQLDNPNLIRNRRISESSVQMAADHSELRLPVFFHDRKIIDSTDGTQVLRPDVGNVHEIRAVDDQHSPCVFFDLLTPRYHPPSRDCHYYTPVHHNNSDPFQYSPGDLLHLAPVTEQSTGFWTLPWNN